MDLEVAGIGIDGVNVDAGNFFNRIGPGNGAGGEAGRPVSDA